MVRSFLRQKGHSSVPRIQDGDDVIGTRRAVPAIAACKLHAGAPERKGGQRRLQPPHDASSPGRPKRSHVASFWKRRHRGRCGRDGRTAPAASRVSSSRNSVVPPTTRPWARAGHRDARRRPRARHRPAQPIDIGRAPSRRHAAPARRPTRGRAPRAGAPSVIRLADREAQPQPGQTIGLAEGAQHHRRGRQPERC
jgi:hypothetical protein